MKETKSLPMTMAAASLLAFSLAGHAQPQPCDLLCTPGFWKTTDINSVMEIIIPGKEKVNAKDANGATPLHFAAAFCQDHEVVKVLIDSGADIDASAGFDFAFLRDPAVHNKNLDKFESGEFWGANSPETETTPLHWAAGINKNPDVILVLIDAGADISALTRRELTPLHAAAILNPATDVVIALLHAGADINALASNDDTPLHWAATTNTNPDVILALLDAGSDLEARNDFYDNTPLLDALHHNEHQEVSKVLLGAGADINARTKHGITPLHWAAARITDLDIISALLDAGADADINARTKNGASPLHAMAFSNINPDAIKALLDAGADADINVRTEEGITPLHLAAGNNINPEVTMALLEAGSDINARDEDGNTPLHLVARDNENPDVILSLLDSGADPMAMTAGGALPIDLAKGNPYIDKDSEAYRRLHQATEKENRQNNGN